MDGLLRSVGNGISGFFGGAVAAIGNALRGAFESLNATFHGGGGIVVAIAVALIVLVGVLILRH